MNRWLAEEFPRLRGPLQYAVLVRHIGLEVVGIAVLRRVDDAVLVEALARSGAAARGVGSELMAALEAASIRMGARGLRLDAADERLVSYYERLGFRRIGEVIADDAWGTLFPMWKQLG